MFWRRARREAQRGPCGAPAPKSVLLCSEIVVFLETDAFTIVKAYFLALRAAGGPRPAPSLRRAARPAAALEMVVFMLVFNFSARLGAFYLMK